MWDTLLGSDSTTGADLRVVPARRYPFSPAFMDTLVHVSSALQRSRTALKLMRQLLVDHRDDLRLGQLVPLGDLYDVITRGGDQPFTETAEGRVRSRPEALRRPSCGPTCWTSTTSPRTTSTPTGTGAQRPDPQLAARVRAFIGDDRLIKTLLLSALAPSVPALRNLTVRRLSALNHGSITSPIPGGEVAQVKRKVDEWAAQFGEIKSIDGDDPAYGWNWSASTSTASSPPPATSTTPGARRTWSSGCCWDELGIPATDGFVDQANLIWRGSRRTIEVVFGNVRDSDDLRDDAFHPFDPNAWRLIIDYPFDEGSHGPADDRNRVQRTSTATPR